MGYYRNISLFFIGFKKGISYFMKIVIAIFILGIIVIVHELGHFLLAKKNGITVTEFSIGMGPRIASFVKHGTRYSLKLFPIGGSCMMLGEDEAVEDEGAFDKKSVWARFSVIFAGAFFNFLFAFILALILLGNTGVDMPVVTKVEKHGSAYQSLQSGDVITKINGSPIHFSRDIDYYFMFTPLSDKPVNITYTRDGEKNSVKITPKWRDYYQLGCGYTPTSKIAMLEEVYAGYPLEKAGLAVGDVIIAVDGAKISTAEDFAAYFINKVLKHSFRYVVV
jgi:regulator of sigma E protease